MSKAKVIRPQEMPGWFYGYKSAPEVFPLDRTRARAFLEEEIEGSNGLQFGIAELDPGDIHYLHHHEKEAEFYYVVSGSAKVTVDEEEIAATPGTLIYMPPGTKHKIVNDGKETFVIMWGFNTFHIEPPVWHEEPMLRFNR
jgi:mannose-6-phosphate isomerase-like protein (cupin superfamily)